MKRALPVFQALVKARCGLLFEGDGEAKLLQALRERIAALDIRAADYHAKLLTSEAEFQALISLLTINETYFFREPEQIRLLVERLVPRLLVARGGLVPLRILSAGCSSGEEPYSLVMALMEKYGESTSRLFEFVGGDIDHTVLAKARAGRYSDFSFRGVPAAVKQRYFDAVQRDNLLKPQVRSQVTFVELNLLADHFAPELRDFDIIFFRNVSIYFDSPTRKVIQKKLASLLKPDGVLVIGTAETLANDLGVLVLVEEDDLFYFTQGQPNAPDVARALPERRVSTTHATSQPFNALTSPFNAVLTPPLVLSVPLMTALPVTTAGSDAVLAQARQLIKDKRFDEALLRLDAVLATELQHEEAALLKAHVLIHRRDFGAAQAVAERVLATDAWSVDALVLLGLAAKWRGQEADAIRWFKQAAYASNECWPAHYYLADLYRASGDTALARRAYRVVLQLLSGPEPIVGMRHVPLGLPEAEVRFLCEHQLARLSGVAARAEAR